MVCGLCSADDIISGVNTTGPVQREEEEVISEDLQLLVGITLQH